MDRLLLVDDSRDCFELIKLIVNGSTQLEWARTVTEAKCMISKKTYDVFLIDVRLPDGIGFELCAGLQANCETWNTPALMLTS